MSRLDFFTGPGLVQVYPSANIPGHWSLRGHAVDNEVPIQLPSKLMAEVVANMIRRAYNQGRTEAKEELRGRLGL